MHIIEQGAITDRDTIARLGIFDIERAALSNIGPEGMRHMMDVRLINVFTYAIVKIDMGSYPDVPGFGWRHVGSDHVDVARAFWNAFHATQKGDLHFSDAPDFSGKIDQGDGTTCNFWGDIGQISALTWALYVWPGMRPGDMWIGVPDTSHQIILTAQEVIRDQQTAITEGLMRVYAGKHKG